MTEKEQIRKMAQFFCRHCENGICKFDLKECDMACKWGLNANGLFNAGCRKVPENSVILTPEERDEEIKAYNEERAEFENEIYALNEENANLTVENEVLTRDNYDLERTLEEGVEELQADKYEAVKEFAEKVKEKALSHCRIINFYECKFIETTIDELLEEYEK